jgi:hypothetical protein
VAGRHSVRRERAVAKKKEPLEKEYYPRVARWLKRHFHCFKVVTNRGLKFGRIDVIGIRDIGGDLSGEVETIAVEVKRGKTPFANACGQAFGYSIYANRVYLADVRPERFTPDETFIASNLGIGLIHVRDKKCGEVLSSPFYQPITKMQLGLFESLRLGRCQLCNSVFEIGVAEGGNRYSKLARENVKRAIEEGKGLVFWNREVAERKRKVGLRGSKEDDTTWERRFLCPDCVDSVLKQLHSKGQSS